MEDTLLDIVDVVPRNLGYNEGNNLPTTAYAYIRFIVSTADYDVCLDGPLYNNDDSPRAIV